jgi:hypothetical protein
LVRLAKSAGLEEFAGVYALPGQAASPVAVASLRDGTGLLLTAEGRKARVAGRYRGPLIGAQIDGQFAIARSGEMLHLLRVSTPEVQIFKP